MMSSPKDLHFYNLSSDVIGLELVSPPVPHQSIETVNVDGTGRYSFLGLLGKGTALSLAVFEGFFYWVDIKGLWKVPQNQPEQKKLLWKAELPLMNVFHELQQPQGTFVISPVFVTVLIQENFSN